MSSHRAGRRKAERKKIGPRKYLAAGLVVIGLASTTVSLTAPTAVSQAVDATQNAVSHGIERVAGSKPHQVALGPVGGQMELDMCSGSWIRLEDFADVKELTPLYGLHNYCGGRKALDWDAGDEVQVKGKGLHVISDIRDVSAKADTVDVVKDMKGKLVLQTCHWGNKKLRFVALAPAG